MELSKRQRSIYDHVAGSGPGGAPVLGLLHHVFGEEPPASSWGVLRVNIFEINRKIKERGQKIKGRRDVGYILTGNRSGETEGDD